MDKSIYEKQSDTLIIQCLFAQRKKYSQAKIVAGFYFLFCVVSVGVFAVLKSITHNELITGLSIGLSFATFFAEGAEKPITGDITQPGNDDTANTGDKDHGRDAVSVTDDKTNWAMNTTGTQYTIYINGEQVTLNLDAGKTLYGDVKGYQSSGYNNMDKYGSEFDLPADKLQLSREEWAAVATKKGRT